MDTGSGMKMETYRIIASSGQAIFQGKQQNYVMLTGLSINFHLHYLDALKKNLIAIAVVISLLIVLIIRIAVRQGHLPFVMSAMPLKASPPRILMRGWNRHGFPLSWSNWLSRSII
ncbi:sensor kinase CusS [Klebsiella quasipneumoniae]|nr:sensor kinase CusS [Klebsiella quasipneumoniae]